MVNRRAAFVSAALIAAMTLAGSLAWMCMPPDTRIEIHFDTFGRGDGWTTPARAFLTIPMLSILVWGLLAVLPRIDPRRANLARSAKAYGTLWIAIIVVLCVFEGAIIARTFGAKLPVSRFAVAMIGALFVVMGNVLGKIRWNYTVGIRTPWTLADERVWDKTHRFGGWAFVAGGLLLLITAFAMPSGAPAFALAVPIVLAIASATILKSYLLWRDRMHP